MRSLYIKSLTVALLMAGSLSICFGQETLTEYKNNIEQLKSGNKQLPEGVSLNAQMIENFYQAYDQTEVLPWDQLISQKSFDDIKLYLNAYQNLNSTEIDCKNVADIIDSKVQETKNELQEGLTKNQPVAEHSSEEDNSLFNNL